MTINSTSYISVDVKSVLHSSIPDNGSAFLEK